MVAGHASRHVSAHDVAIMLLRGVLPASLTLSPPFPADLSALQSAQRTAFWSQNSRPVAAQREKLRAALEELYATSSNLASYVEQNRTGFRKILKKHDKLVSVSGVVE